MQAGMLMRPVATAARQAIRRSAPCAAAGASRAASEWLQGRPPAVSHTAGTVASFYYKNIRDFDIPTKDHVVAVDQDAKMTVSQFDRHVYAYAVGMLEAWNLRKGHKIAVWCVNELESVVTQYAAALIGIEVVVIDPSLGFTAVKQLINSEGIRALVVSPRSPSGEDRHAGLAAEFAPELEYTVTSAGYMPIQSKRFRSLKYLACTSQEFVNGIMRFNELPVYGNNGTYAHDDIAALQAYVSPSQPAITYVSAGGADGASPVKGRTVTHAELLASAGATAKALGLTSSDVVLSTAPVWTFAGLTGAFMAAANASGGGPAKVVLAARKEPASVTDVLKAAELHRPTVLVTTPEHAAAISAAAAEDAAKPAGKRSFEGALSALRTGAVVVRAGGAPASPVALGKAKLAPVDAATGM